MRCHAERDPHRTKRANGPRPFARCPAQESGALTIGGRMRRPPHAGKRLDPAWRASCWLRARPLAARPGRLAESLPRNQSSRASRPRQVKEPARREEPPRSSRAREGGACATRWALAGGIHPRGRTLSRRPWSGFEYRRSQARPSSLIGRQFRSGAEPRDSPLLVARAPATRRAPGRPLANAPSPAAGGPEQAPCQPCQPCQTKARLPYPGWS